MVFKRGVDIGIPSEHNRRSLRLKNYDYSLSGAYFITISINNKASLLGEIKNDGDIANVKLNDAGLIVEKWLMELVNKFSNLQLDEYIIMPDHIHVIILLDNVGTELCVCPSQKACEDTGSPLHRMVQWFKTMTTNEYIKNVKLNKWPPFKDRFWQRNYYEHIIRNEISLNEYRQYIINNPIKADDY